jgi:hypothetical protein
LLDLPGCWEGKLRPTTRFLKERGDTLDDCLGKSFREKEQMTTGSTPTLKM